MRRILLVCLAAGALGLAACGSGSHGSAAASTTTTVGTPAGPPPCKATVAKSGDHYTVTVTSPGPATVYVEVKTANPPTQAKVIPAGQSTTSIDFPVSSLPVAKVTVYANRLMSTCTAIPA